MQHLCGLRITGTTKEEKRENARELYKFASGRVAATADARGYKAAIVQYIAAVDRTSAFPDLPVGITVEGKGTSGTASSPSHFSSSSTDAAPVEGELIFARPTGTTGVGTEVSLVALILEH